MSDIRINQIQNIPTKQTEKKATEEKTTEEAVKSVETSQKDASEVLSFMAQSGALNKAGITSKEVDTTKYVDESSENRIETMMKTFEETILKSAEVAIKEFGLSEEQGQDVAIMAFNEKYLV